MTAKKTKLKSFTHPCPQPPHTVLFDLDGTLIDSAAVIAASYNAGLTATGHRPLGRRNILAMLGPPLETLYSHRIPERDVAAACEAYRTTFAELYAAHVTAAEGAAALLDKLRAAGVRTGVVTNRARLAEELLTQCGLRERVDAVVTLADGPYAAKPNPEMLYVAMEKLDAIPAETCYVGGSTADMQAGTAAHLWNIGVTSLGLDADVLEGVGAHVVTHSLTALAVVLGLEKPAPAAPASATTTALAHGARVAVALGPRQAGPNGSPAQPPPATEPAPTAEPAPEATAPPVSLSHGARVAFALRPRSR